MGKKKNISICLKIFLAAVLALCFFNLFSFANCFIKSRNLSMQDNEILRIRFFGNTEENGTNTVSANIVLLDNAGTEIAVVERSWNGSFLAMDFVKTEFYGSNYYFPLDIYAVNSISEVYKNNKNLKKTGTNLTKYYIDLKRCLLVQPIQLQKKLFSIADFSLNPFIFVSVFFTKKITLSLHECEGGKTYGIYVKKDGIFRLEEELPANPTDL